MLTDPKSAVSGGRITGSHAVWMAQVASRHPRDLRDEQWHPIDPSCRSCRAGQMDEGVRGGSTAPCSTASSGLLRTGAPWADLPDRYPLYQTCHRRFHHWVREGLLRSILEVLPQALHREGRLDLREAFIDGSFAPAKQGGADVGKTKRRKGVEDHGHRGRQGFPIDVHVESATPHEVTLVCATSPRCLSGRSPRVSSATTPTSRTDWMQNWPGEA